MEKPSTARIALKWGLIIGIVLIIFSTVSFMTELWKQGWASWLPYLFILGGIIMALKEFKEANAGFLNFGQALGLGTLKSAVTGLIAALFSTIYTSFIDTTAMEKIMNFQKEKMSEQGLSDEQIEQAMEMTSKFMTPSMMFIVGIVMYIIAGFFFSLIAGAIMQKKKPEIEFN
jgi:hypothetical protein